MKKLLGAVLVLSAGVVFAGDKGLKEVSLDELDEITGGGVRDPKIILWDEAHRNAGVNHGINRDANGNTATYGTSAGVNEVSMR